jgi:hypothetical protein
MVEHVTVLELGVTWEPNAPDAVLVSNDFGKTALGLNAHADDEDKNCVVLVWTGTRSACLADPNDEAISGHRLYAKGLEGVLWAGEVHESELIRDLERQNRVHPRHQASRFESLMHHILLLKECVAEVVAEEVEVRRLNGPTLDAASSAMR